MNTALRDHTGSYRLRRKDGDDLDTTTKALSLALGEQHSTSLLYMAPASD